MKACWHIVKLYHILHQSIILETTQMSFTHCYNARKIAAGLRNKDTYKVSDDCELFLTGKVQ